MELLIVAATEAEIAKLIQICDRQFLPEFPGLSVCVIPGATKPFHVLITGVGAPATIFGIQQAIVHKNFDLLVQAGICGAFERSLTPGTAVIVEQDRFAGMGVEDGPVFLDIFETGLESANSAPYRDGWIIPEPIHLKAVESLLRVKGITVETVTGSAETAAMRENKYHPHIESMEGAALFYVCARTLTPCLQIRTVSNFVEKRNKLNWNIPLAVESLNTYLIMIIKETCT